MPRIVPFLVLLLALPLAAQNFLPNGDFEAGKTGWTNTRMTDPKGSAAIDKGPTTALGTSHGLYGDFQTLTPVFYCNWESAPFVLPPIPSIPLRFDVTWEKKVTKPIPSKSVNRVQFWIKDAAKNTVFASGKLYVPQTTGYCERLHYSSTLKLSASAPAKYYVEIQMRHSNLAKMPYRVWFDNIVIGPKAWDLYGIPCKGGSGAPAISASGTPSLGSTNWKVEASNPAGPGLALGLVGHSTARWNALKLPFDLGGGCSLYTGMTLMFPVVLGSGGSGGVVLPIPKDPFYVGVDLYAQYLVVDKGSASPFGLTATSGLRFDIRK